MANSHNSRHTIILLQNSPNRATRTFMDYDSIGQAMDGICGLYERKLKEINPSLRNLSYDISDLYNFTDGLADMSALVYEHSMNAYMRYDKLWSKQKAFHHVKDLQVEADEEASFEEHIKLKRGHLKHHHPLKR